MLDLTFKSNFYFFISIRDSLRLTIIVYLSFQFVPPISTNVTVIYDESFQIFFLLNTTCLKDLLTHG